MILKVILLLAAAFAVYQLFNTRKTIPAMLTIGLIVALLMVVLPFLHMYDPGKYIYIGFVFLALVYGIFTSGKSVGERIILTLMPAGILAYWIWVTNHWHGNTLLLAYLVIILAIIGLFFRKKFKNEIGYLSILAADALAIVLEYFLK